MRPWWFHTFYFYTVLAKQCVYASRMHVRSSVRVSSNEMYRYSLRANGCTQRRQLLHCMHVRTITHTILPPPPPLLPWKDRMRINYEFGKVVAWALENTLGINMAKTEKIVFHRPHPWNLLLPTTLPGIWKGVVRKTIMSLVTVWQWGWAYM